MQNELINEAIHLIEESGYACVVIKNNKIVDKKTGRGIGPILQLYESGTLENAVVIDKIIGKASAVILSLAKASEVYGIIMSKDATAWFENVGIKYEAGMVTEKILNRAKTGICPMEMAVANMSDPEDMYIALKAKIAELSANKN